MTGLSRHNHHHAATSTAPTRPHPNTTPSPPITASTAPSPSGTHISDVNWHPNPAQQAHNGATYTGAVSTCRYCHVGVTQIRFHHTATALTWSPPPLRSATTPPTPPHLDAAALALSRLGHHCHVGAPQAIPLPPPHNTWPHSDKTSDCHFNMAATHFNPFNTATTTSTPPHRRCPIMVATTTPIAMTPRHCHCCPLQHLAPIV
ncbi:hypothetical protein EDB89DRAFT_1914927 [Lactarius sanguifluus]|nr:hypothetical protein EDB89DRAFT_1914927 [Lactarius sanguifluus]